MLASDKDVDFFDDGWHKVDKEANGYIDTEDLVPFLLQLERPLRPLGVPFGDTPEHRVAARKIVNGLVERGDLPKNYTQAGGYLNYGHVLRTLIDNSYVSYNKTFADEPVNVPPIVESTPIASLRGWGMIRSKGIVGVLRAQFANEGNLSPSLLARAKLGKGTQTEQVSALTDLLRFTCDEADKMERDAKRDSQRIADLESLLTAEQRAVVVHRIEERREKEKAKFKTTTAASATALALANKDLVKKGLGSVAASAPQEQFDPFAPGPDGKRSAPAPPPAHVPYEPRLSVEEEEHLRMLREGGTGFGKANFGERSQSKQRGKDSKYRDLTYDEKRFEDRARKEQDNPMKAGPQWTTPPLGIPAKRNTGGASPALSARSNASARRNSSPTPRGGGGTAGAKLPPPAALPPPQKRPTSGGSAGGHVVLEEKTQTRGAAR